jgi:hypothetical protein
MGQFTTGRKIPKLDQLITVNGAEDPRLWCESIRVSSGMGNTTADFSVPEFLFDSYAADMRDALVVVYIFPVGSGPSGEPDFVGYLLNETSGFGPNEDRKGFSAKSVSGLLHRVHVGQNLSGGARSTKLYNLVDPVTGKKTGLKPRRVLEDIFDKMPDYYKARVALGTMKILNDTSEVTCPQLNFRLAEVSNAVEQVMALYGDVTYNERFDASGKVLLDFYRIQDPNAPKVALRLSEWDDPKTSGATIQQISKTDSSADSITRVQGFGAPKLMMVSCKSYVAALTGQSQSVETKRLIRDWETKWEAIVKSDPKHSHKEQGNYTVTASPTFPPIAAADIGAGTASFAISKQLVHDVPLGSVLVCSETLEQMLVTAYTAPVDPEAENAVGTVTVTRGYNATTAATIKADSILEWQMPGIEYVFRRYKLPKSFWPFKKRRENALKRTDVAKTPYPVQVWTYKSLLKSGESGDIEEGELEGFPVGAVSTIPSLVEGAHIDLENNRITLNKCALVCTKQQPSETDPEATKTTWVETVVGVTFTYEADAELFHDTGQPSTQTPGWTSIRTGFTDRWQRNDLIFSQLTNNGYPVIDEHAEEQLHGCVYFDLDDNETVVIKATTEPVTIQDDTKIVKTECEKILCERNRRARAYNITLPMFTRGFTIGQAVEIFGEQNYEPDCYKITTIETEHSLEGAQSTVLTIDNVKPPHRQKQRIRRGAGGAQHSGSRGFATSTPSGWGQAHGMSSGSGQSSAAASMAHTLDSGAGGLETGRLDGFGR